MGAGDSIADLHYECLVVEGRGFLYCIRYSTTNHCPLPEVKTFISTDAAEASEAMRGIFTQRKNEKIILVFITRILVESHKGASLLIEKSEYTPSIYIHVVRLVYERGFSKHSAHTAPILPTLGANDS